MALPDDVRAEIERTRTELVRSRAFVRASETQLTKTLAALDALEGLVSSYELRVGEPAGWGLGAPDLSQLPVASSPGEMPDYTAYDALGIPGMAAGLWYFDPHSGVRVWKATSALTWGGNTGGGHDYGDGGAQVSREWDGDQHTIAVHLQGASETHFLMDFRRGVGFSNARSLPTGAKAFADLRLTFSRVAATPRILYTLNSSSVLHRINTATDAVENTGNFPHQFSTTDGWLQTDRFDKWFVKVDGTGIVRAWNSETDAVLSRTFSGLDEPHLELDGRYVAVIYGVGASMVFWDLETDTLSSVMTRSGTAPFTHPASLRSFFATFNQDLGAPIPWDFYRLPVTGGAPTPTYIYEPAVGSNAHNAGQWDQDVSTTLQYALTSPYNLGATDEIMTAADDPDPLAGRQDSRQLLQAAVGFLRLDGGDARYLCGHWTRFDEGQYWELPRATISPDGKIVLFDSHMHVTDGRADLFVVEVPLS